MFNLRMKKVMAKPEKRTCLDILLPILLPTFANFMLPTPKNGHFSPRVKIGNKNFKKKRSKSVSQYPTSHNYSKNQVHENLSLSNKFAQILENYDKRICYQRQ